MEKVLVGDVEVYGDVDLKDLETRVSMIQALIPLGLEAVADVLQQEVSGLAGVRYGRKASEQPYRRWRSQQGSVYLLDQKLPVDLPRVRDLGANAEGSPASYRALQQPRKMDEGLFLRVVKGGSPVATTKPARRRFRRPSASRRRPSPGGSSKPLRRS